MLPLFTVLFLAPPITGFPTLQHPLWVLEVMFLGGGLGHLEELLGFPEYHPGVHEVYVIKLLFSPVNLPFIMRGECRSRRVSAKNL